MRALAAAVILRAIADATSDTRWTHTQAYPNREEIEDARTFLLGGEDLEFWCAVADITHGAVVAKAIRLQRRGWISELCTPIDYDVNEEDLT